MDNVVGRVGEMGVLVGVCQHLRTEKEEEKEEEDEGEKEE